MQLSLPCECGNSVEVSPSQCGRTVRCTCGKGLSVPAFRELQQLQRLRGQNVDNDAQSLDSQGLVDVLHVAKSQRMVLASLLALFAFFASVFVLGRIANPIPPTLFWPILWTISLVLAWNIFRVAIRTSGFVVAAILSVLAFLPFLFVVGAIVAILQANKHLRDAGYAVWILGIRSSEYQRFKNELRRKLHEG